MSFRLALSGLNAATANLNVTAHNIANTATTGFKESRAEFADLFAVTKQGVSSTAVGNGVRVASVAQQFSQGNIDFTDNSLDLAISGQGFFVMSDNGAISYSRAGAFRLDNQGYVVNSQQQRLQVFPPTSNGQFNTGGLTDLRLVTAESAPRASTSVEMVFNLPSNAEVPTSTPFDATDANTYNHSTSVTLYDSLGASHTGTLYFVKTANPNEWTAHLYVNGTAVGTPQTLEYSSTGTLVDPPNGEVNFGGTYTPTTGADPLDLTFDFARATQYGSNFGMNAVSQDGYTTGRLIGIDIDATGVVQARFTNGRSLSLGQVAIANFQNAQGLQQLGGTAWAETFSSGPALLGQAGTSDFGLIQSGALEGSNVDITEQLVNMITAQRNFQANAQMISTADAITQTIINMR